MRILTIGNLYPPHHFGGYEQVWQSAVAHLRTRGHSVRVLATAYRHAGVDDSDEPDVYRVLGWYWREHEFAFFPLRQRLAVERGNHDALLRHVREWRPDVVSFWSMGGMSHSLIERVRRLGLPIVAFVHDPWFDYGRFTDQWLRLWWPRWIWPVKTAMQRLTGIPVWIDYGAAGRWVFVSEYLRRRALALPLGLTDSAVAPSGIHPRFLSEPLGPQREWTWRLLFVGRIHPDKGIFEAVATLAHLAQEATLTFAGSWDEREERALAERVAAAGLQARVRMLGRVPAERLVELYRSHDALLFPVVWEEPWGLVPLEAMACGCPVIATGRGGSGEYLRDRANCLLVPDADPQRLASAVVELARSPGLRGQLREAGRATAERHTEPAFNAAVERHLTEVVAARGRTR